MSTDILAQMPAMACNARSRAGQRVSSRQEQQAKTPTKGQKQSLRHCDAKRPGAQGHCMKLKTQQGHAESVELSVLVGQALTRSERLLEFMRRNMDMSVSCGQVPCVCCNQNYVHEHPGVDRALEMSQRLLDKEHRRLGAKWEAEDPHDAVKPAKAAAIDSLLDAATTLLKSMQATQDVLETELLGSMEEFSVDSREQRTLSRMSTASTMPFFSPLPSPCSTAAKHAAAPMQIAIPRMRASITYRLAPPCSTRAEVCQKWMTLERKPIRWTR